MDLIKTKTNVLILAIHKELRKKQKKQSKLELPRLFE